MVGIPRLELGLSFTSFRCLKATLYQFCYIPEIVGPKKRFELLCGETPSGVQNRCNQPLCDLGVRWERKMESNHVSKLMRLTGEPAPLQPLMVPLTRFELV